MMPEITRINALVCNAEQTDVWYNLDSMRGHHEQ